MQDNKLELQDIDGDRGSEGNYSTDDLASSGHDRAVDDKQQITACVKKLKKVASLITDKYISRRVARIASEMVESYDLPADLISTESLQLPGQEGETPIDEGQKDGELELYGTEPADKEQGGPEPSPQPSVSDDEDSSKGSKVSKKASAWKELKSTLGRIGSKSGKFNGGVWSTQFADFGKSVDFSVVTHSATGAQLSEDVITFTRIGRTASNGNAMVEINDPSLNMQTVKKTFEAGTVTKNVEGLVTGLLQKAQKSLRESN